MIQEFKKKAEEKEKIPDKLILVGDTTWKKTKDIFTKPEALTYESTVAGMTEEEKSERKKKKKVEERRRRRKKKKKKQLQKKELEEIEQIS